MLLVSLIRKRTSGFTITGHISIKTPISTALRLIDERTRGLLVPWNIRFNGVETLFEVFDFAKKDFCGHSDRSLTILPLLDQSNLKKIDSYVSHMRCFLGAIVLLSFVKDFRTLPYSSKRLTDNTFFARLIGVVSPSHRDVAARNDCRS